MRASTMKGCQPLIPRCQSAPNGAPFSPHTNVPSGGMIGPIARIGFRPDIMVSCTVSLVNCALLYSCWWDPNFGDPNFGAKYFVGFLLR